MTTVAFEASGTTWFGTEEGIAKLKDTTWTVYDTSNSEIPGVNIGNINCDSSGNTWFSCSKMVVCDMVKFDGTSFTVYTNSNSGWPGGPGGAMTIDKQGDKWMGTWLYGFVKFNDTDWTLYNTSNSELPNLKVYDLAHDSNGNIWIADWEGGLVVFNENGIIAIKDKPNTYSRRKHKICFLQSYPIVHFGYSTSKQSFIKLKLFNIKKRVIKTLISEFKDAGNHRVKLDCSDISNGTYFINLCYDTYSVSKKINVIK